MEEKSRPIKDDINFLENPTFLLDDKNTATELLIEKENGKYEITCSSGLPDLFDKKVLYFLLQKLYQETKLKKYTVKARRYEIARIVSTSAPGKKQYGIIF